VAPFLRLSGREISICQPGNQQINSSYFYLRYVAFLQ